MDDCVFCKIIAGELPSVKIYEDAKVLAFLDIQPINFGHALVIPKKHYGTLVDLPDDLLKELIPIVKLVGKAILAGLKADGFNVGLNNGRAAGQLVSHVHFHVIPRRADDGLEHWPAREYQAGEKEKIAQKIITALK